MIYFLIYIPSCSILPVSSQHEQMKIPAAMMMYANIFNVFLFIFLFPFVYSPIITNRKRFVNTIFLFDKTIKLVTDVTTKLFTFPNHYQKYRYKLFLMRRKMASGILTLYARSHRLIRHYCLWTYAKCYDIIMLIRHLHYK